MTDETTVDGIKLPEGDETPQPEDNAEPTLAGVEVVEEGETMVGDAGVSYVPAEADLDAETEPPVL